MCQGRPLKQRKKIVEEVREIDICRYLAGYFGHSGHLAAQGTSDIDLEVKGPTIRAEVKYLRPKSGSYSEAKKDWDWLMNVSNTGDEFKKRAWVVFWPSARNDMFSLTNCISVPKSHDSQYCLSDFSPFTPYAEPEMPPHGSNQRLTFRKDNHSRTTIVEKPGGRRARVDLIGELTHPLWCALYTRVTPTDSILSSADSIRLSDSPIQI